jgi:hypothetical protein
MAASFSQAMNIRYRRDRRVPGRNMLIAWSVAGYTVAQDRTPPLRHSLRLT